MKSILLINRRRYFTLIFAMGMAHLFSTSPAQAEPPRTVEQLDAPGRVELRTAQRKTELSNQLKKLEASKAAAESKIYDANNALDTATVKKSSKKTAEQKRIISQNEKRVTLLTQQIETVKSEIVDNDSLLEDFRNAGAVMKAKAAEATSLSEKTATAPVSTVDKRCETLKRNTEQYKAHYLKLNKDPAIRDTPVWEDAHHKFWVSQARLFSNCPAMIPPGTTYEFVGKNWKQHLGIRTAAQNEFFSKNCKFITNLEKRKACEQNLAKDSPSADDSVNTVKGGQ